MNETKDNLNKPEYAKNNASGRFAAGGPTYQCSYCGKTAFTSNKPSSYDMMPCSPGHSCHNWQKC